MTGRMQKSRRGSERGSAIIEFALVLPLMLLLIFGITEFGRALMTTNILTQAAREGARVQATAADTTATKVRINAVLSAANVTPSLISIAGPGGGDAITVIVESNFNFLAANVLSGTITLRGTSIMRSEI